MVQELATRPRTEQIEAYFRRYPDVPREVIVKEDIVNLGQRFTEAALGAAEGSMVKSYRLFSYDMVRMADMEQQEHKRAPESFLIEAGPYGLRTVQLQTRMAPDSPYLVDLVDGRLALLLDGVAVARVRYPEAPDYYARSFEDGTRYHEIIANGNFCTVFRTCQYWGPKEECKFCDINENARQMKQSHDFTVAAPVKRADYVAEVANEIQREADAKAGHPVGTYYVLTGGTILNKLHGKTEEQFYSEYVEALKWGGGRRYITLQTNARPKEIMRHYRAAGVDNHNANMEVWDRRLFEWINPGKARRIGWENWVKWMCESVDVFGDGNVTPNLVAGVEMAKPYGFATVAEAVQSTAEGLDVLMSHGVMPRFNHWCREAGSYLVKEHEQPPPPLDYYIQILAIRYELWKKYRLPYPHGNYRYDPMHPNESPMGVYHGAYDDFILLMEDRKDEPPPA